MLYKTHFKDLKEHRLAYCLEDEFIIIYVCYLIYFWFTELLFLTAFVTSLIDWYS